MADNVLINVPSVALLEVHEARVLVHHLLQIALVLEYPLPRGHLESNEGHHEGVAGVEGQFVAVDPDVVAGGEVSDGREEGGGDHEGVHVGGHQDVGVRYLQKVLIAQDIFL